MNASAVTNLMDLMNLQNIPFQGYRTRTTARKHGVTGYT